MRRSVACMTILLGVLLVVSGCGSGQSQTVARSSPSTGTTTGRSATPAARVEAAVIDTIRQSHRLSVEVLWTNQVPANQSTNGGPDLAALRRSAAQRRVAGVRVRVLSEHFHITGVQLDPSYTAASATAVDDERVQPSYPDGRPHGRATTLHEHVRLYLHRVNGTERFIVWKVVLLP
jgi:hypothetical protein